MGKKYLIALDDGHGIETAGKRTPYIEQLGRTIRENEFNRAVKRLLAEELIRCGFDIILVAPTDADTPLAERVRIANEANADAYVAIHFNAWDGTFEGHNPEGISVHIYTKTTMSEPLAKAVHKYLLQGTTQKDRGIVRSNFYVLRNTKMPAILTENGFMDNPREALLMVNTDFQKEVAIEHTKGICEYFKVEYVDVEDVKKYERVQTGSFDIYNNAVNWRAEMIKHGFADAFIIRGADGQYKVQVGAFQTREYAVNRANELKAKGFPVYITDKSGTIINEAPKVAEKIIRVGSKVMVKKDSMTFTGRKLASFVYTGVYDVIQVDKDRIVIGKGKNVTAAINRKDLILV